MPHLQSIIVAGATGFISGLLLSIPVGPVNLTIMNEGARRGFAWASLIGAGATVMEVIYCSIAFTGFASLLEAPFIKTAMELFTFGFMIFLGLKFLLIRSVQKMNRIEERIEGRLHPHSAFMIGLVRVLGNLGVLVGWIALTTQFILHGWVEPNGRGKLACITGVALGTGLWFLGLSWAVSLGHRKLTERTLLRMERFSGVFLLGLGLLYGLRIVWEATHHSV